MNTNPTQPTSDMASTISRLKKLAQVTRFLNNSINDLTEESEYFLAKQSLQDFEADLTKLNLELELAEDMRKFVEFLNVKLEEKYKLHRS